VGASARHSMPAMKLYILILFLHPSLLSTYSDSTAFSDESGYVHPNKRSATWYDDDSMSYVSPCKRCVQRKPAVSLSSYNLSPQYSYDDSAMNSASGDGESSSSGVRRAVVWKTPTNSSAHASKAFQNITEWKTNRTRDFLAYPDENLTKKINKKVQISEIIKLLEGAQGQFRAYSDASARALLKNGGKLSCFSWIIFHIM
uniref:Uncharacterized protein n=2 Tax=Parascaris univalens TaxID=6257 RepID=A0A915BJC2_PARUN